MLSFARRQFHDTQVIDVRATLGNCDSILDQMAGAGASVRLALGEARLFAALDASQLEMALLNLVRNAAGAASADGRIVVSARARDLDGPGSAAAVEVSVADTGSGMSAEVAQKALEPFFTTKAPGKSTGLGLSMVRGFVEQSGGRVELQTAPGAGTTVRLVFPAVVPPGV